MWALLPLLAFVGGYADAGSFLLVSSFTGHVTGNTVLAMIGVATGTWRQAGLCLLAVVGFAAGTAAGSRNVRLTVALGAEILLAAAGLAALATARAGGDLVFITCLCLALGLQNGTLRTVEGVGVHTTYVTGMSTNLIASLVAPSARARDGAPLARAIVAFVVGALTGAALTARFGVSGFGGIVVPMAVALLVAALNAGDQKSRSL